MDGEPSLKGAWSGYVNHFNFGGHQPYLWNGSSFLRCCQLWWTISVINWWRSRSPVYHTDRWHMCTTRWAYVTASRGSVSGSRDLLKRTDDTRTLFYRALNARSTKRDVGGDGRLRCRHLANWTKHTRCFRFWPIFLP